MKHTLLLAWALSSPLGALAADNDIVITGDRRAVDRSQVAGSIGVLDAKDLEEIGAQHPAEALNRIPGVGFHRGSGVETLPSIRSPVLTGGDGAGSILLLQDGVPIRAPGLANINAEFEAPLDFADRVEVVRGPGSALYGSNAVHGLINVITPSTGRKHDDPRWITSLDAGLFGRVDGSIQRPFGQRMEWANCPPRDPPDELVLDCAYKPSPITGFVALNASHETGWRQDAGVDQQSALIKVGVQVGAWRIQPTVVLLNMNQETAGYVQGTDGYKNTALSRQNANSEAFRDERLVRAQAEVSTHIGGAQLKIAPFARWIDTDLLQHFLPSKALEQTGQRGGGAQTALYLSSDMVRHASWIFGFDIDRSNGSEYEFQSIATQPGGYVQGLHYDYDVASLALAAYAQARWRITDQWTLTAGLRGENVRYEYDNHAPDGDVGRFRRPADRSDTFAAVTPKLGLVRAFESGGSAYFNLARGARPPQTVDLYSLQTLQNAGDQKAETIDSAELGLRQPIGAGKIEVSLYQMMKRHAAFRNANGFTVPNARTEHEGIELSGAYPITAKLRVSGSLTYARHTYRFSNASTLTGETITDGDDVDSAPRWQWNGALTWSPRSDSRIELSWQHMGRYFTNAANTRTYPGHNVLDLRVDWGVTEQATLFATVRNLTNTDYAERADYAFGADRYFPGEDRALSVGVRHTFK